MGKFKIVHFVLSIFVRILFYNKTIIIINGMRRSGNHAFILWLANAIESKPVTMDYTIHSHCGVSDTKGIFHINETNTLCISEILRIYKEFRYTLKNSKYILVSYEDCSPNYYHFLNLYSTYNIFVNRNLLNMVASRLKGLLNLAKNGFGWPSFNIDRGLFDKILDWNNSNNTIIWQYESWLENESYRTQFLKKLNLSYDLMPNIASHGGGSSFVKKEQIVPSNTVNRYKQIDWPERIVNLFKEESYSSLLTPQEKEYLKNL